VRIEGTAALLQAMLGAQAPKRAEPARFDAPAPPTPAPGQVTAGLPVQSVAMLVTLAAAGPSPERRREMAREAEDGLTRLEALHRDLIAGIVAPARLRALRDWTRGRGKPDDPELAQLMDDIELRILVELAKRERG
jgi:hypothetical protein